MYDKESTLKHFSKNLMELNIRSSHEYRKAKCLPSLETLRKYIGGWSTCVELAYDSYNHQPSAEESLSIKEDNDEVKRLTAQVEELRRHLQITNLRLEGTTHKFGYVTDTHIGSLFSDLDLLETAYNIFKKNGITTVFHSGDLVDGMKIYKGQDFELSAVGEDSQINLVEERYPRKDGITTYFIAGNHDRSFWKLSGSDIGPKIQDKRPDLQYLGHQEANIILGDGDNTATIRLIHPDGGSAYAISYKAQRYIAELQSGTKPDILLIGHYHKAEVLFYRGVISVQGGTCQHQTPFMRGKSLAAAMGFWTIDVTVGPNRIIDFSPKFYPVRS